MKPPKLIALLAIPLAAGGCAVLAWLKQPHFAHRAIQLLMHHPVEAMLAGAGAGLGLIVCLLIGFTFIEKHPEADQAMNLVAAEIDPDRRYWWSRYRW